MLENIGKKKKIAVVGTALETFHDAPYNDPEWEIWGMGFFQRYPQVDVMFEQHYREFWLKYNAPEKVYIDSLNGLGVPILMNKHYDEIPLSIEYPLEEMLQKVTAGKKYFCSSVSYMLALAIAKQPEEIGIWGVSLVGEHLEYVHQKANAEYLIGVAEGRGIKVFIPEKSPICKSTHLYGYEDAPPMQAELGYDYLCQQKMILTQQKAALENQIRTLEANYNAIDGGVQTLDQMIQIVKLHNAGFEIRKNYVDSNDKR